MTQNTRMLLGAIIAAVLAIAVYYGLIGQQAATNIQNQANQTLGTTPAQQTVPPNAQTPPAAPAGPVPPNPAPANPAPPAPH